LIVSFSLILTLAPLAIIILLRHYFIIAIIFHYCFHIAFIYFSLFTPLMPLLRHYFPTLAIDT
jgi:hypothetical protein